MSEASDEIFTFTTDRPMRPDDYAHLDFGPLIHGIRWRRCAVCRQRVWETKRGKLSRHMPKPDREGEDPIAASSFEARGPRCEGSGS